MAWIRLLGLPGFMYKKGILEAIGGMICKVAKFDFKSDNRAQGLFARIAVLVNGKIQHVKCESLPTICFSYDKYRNVKELCPLHPIDPICEKGKEAAAVEPREAKIRVVGERKLRHGRSDSSGSKDKMIGTTSTCSRFSALNGLGEIIGANGGFGELILGKGIEEKETLAAVVTGTRVTRKSNKYLEKMLGAS
ncbi:hypothetical protein GOBAR_DD12960 [Gossypium barbadense]|nr:hypothetical protein GOBAR_DD12960 [Gossypium barbadense]